MVKTFYDYNLRNCFEETIQEKTKLVFCYSALELKTENIDNCLEKYFIGSLWYEEKSTIQLTSIDPIVIFGIEGFKNLFQNLLILADVLHGVNVWEK